MPGFKGSMDYEAAKRFKQGIEGVEAAQQNIGNVEGAVQGVQQAYAGLPSMFDQAQAAGAYNMRRTAGQQFAAMAGRGGASNAMASAGAGAANEAMAGQMAQFSSDLAAQRAQAALAGANADLANQASLYDLRQNAAAAPVDAAAAYFAQDIGGKMESGFQTMLANDAKKMVMGGDFEAAQNWIKSFTDPVERKAAYDTISKIGNQGIGGQGMVFGPYSMYAGG